MENLLHRGLPLSLSRWTDVAHWYRPWLCDLITRQGFLFATDPEDGLLKKWSLHPEEVHSLFFWTKNPEALLTPLMTWLAPYRVFTAVTITGWDDTEPRAPDFDAQIEGLGRLVDLAGSDLVRLRFSPVPTDLFVNPVRYNRWLRILDASLNLNLSVDVSLLHDDEHPYEFGSRPEVLTRLVHEAGERGVQLGFCGEDALLLKGQTFRRAECLDSRHLSRVFEIGSSPKTEVECGCLLSVDPCLGPKFGCGSGCSYCYAPYTRR